MDITRLSHIVRGHMAAGTQGGDGEVALSTYTSAQPTTGDVKLQDADAELVFHDQEPRGTLRHVQELC